MNNAQIYCSFHATLANASTISPSFEIAVWQGAIALQIPGERSYHGNFFQNTPVAHGGKKGSFTPLALLRWLPSLHCQWSGIPDADRDTFSDAPRDHQGPRAVLSSPPLPVHPQLAAFHPPLLRGFPFPLPLNDITLIKSVNRSSAL